MTKLGRHFGGGIFSAADGDTEQDFQPVNTNVLEKEGRSCTVLGTSSIRKSMRGLLLSPRQNGAFNDMDIHKEAQPANRRHSHRERDLIKLMWRARARKMFRQSSSSRSGGKVVEFNPIHSETEAEEGEEDEDELPVRKRVDLGIRKRGRNLRKGGEMVDDGKDKQSSKGATCSNVMVLKRMLEVLRLEVGMLRNAWK